MVPSMLAIFCAAVWGFNLIAIKFGIQEIGPQAFTFWRITLLLPLIFFVKKPDMSWKTLIAIGLSLNFLNYFLIAQAIAFGMPTNVIAFVFKIYVPLAMIFATLMYKEKLTAFHITGTLLALGGIALISSTKGNLDVTPIGLALVMAAGTACAFGNTLLKMAPKAQSMQTVVWYAAVSWPALLGVGIVDGQSAHFLYAIQTLSHMGIACLLFSSLGASLFVGSIWTRLISTYGPVAIMPFALLDSVFIMIFSTLLLNETITLGLVTGGSLIILGVWIAEYAKPFVTRRLRKV